MITLTLADVKAKALAAYNEKRLSAQGPTPACMYRDPSGLPCIIGAAMTDEEAEALTREDNVVGVATLRSRGRVKMDHNLDLAKGQELHDSWASAVKNNGVYQGYVNNQLVVLDAAAWEAETVKWLRT